MTNNHVVGTETQVEVDFASGLKTFGNVIGTDAYSDLAVIKVEVAPRNCTRYPWAIPVPCRSGRP